MTKFATFLGESPQMALICSEELTNLLPHLVLVETSSLLDFLEFLFSAKMKPLLSKTSLCRCQIFQLEWISSKWIEALPFALWS